MSRSWLATNAWRGFVVLGLVVVAVLATLPAGSRAWIIVYVGFQASVAVAIAAGLWLHRPHDRRGWGVLVAGVTAYATGSALDYPFSAGLTPTLAFPSVADAFHLLAYLLIATAVARFATARSGGLRMPDVLDALLITGGLGALSFVFLIDPYLHATGGDVVGLAVSVAYPLLDLVMLGATAWLLLGGLRPSPAFALLSLALGVQFASDTLFALSVIDGTLRLDHPSLLPWQVGLASMGAMGLHPTMRSLASPGAAARSVQPARRVPVLLAAVLAAPASGILLSLRRDDHAPVLFVVAALLFLVAFVRVWYLIREVDKARAEAEAARRRAEAADGAKSEFLSRMSHELRTPLNSILGFSQLLAMSDLREDDRDSVEHINAGGRKLLALIDDVLEFARLDTGRITLAIEPVLLTDVADRAIDLVREDARRRGISVHNALRGHHPEVIVSADAHRLRQVLRNLLDNAVRYNRPGGRVTLDARVEGPEVVISVADTGPGLPEELRPTLFEPFSAPSAGMPGAGLGMPFAARIVDALGGRLAFTTSAAGTTFSFRLPAAAAPAIVAASPPSRASVPEHAPRTILYIEDSFANLDLVRSALARHRQVRLLAATRGGTGIELALAQRPDLILLDVKLPDMTADDVVRDLAARPQLAGTPVICLSSDASSPRSESLLALGVRAFLRKPLDIAQFLRAVDGVLDAPARRAAVS